MNETVKAALLAERCAVLNRMACHRTILASARETVERNEASEALESMALSNLESALTEGGVDLAAVDAAAAQRRDPVNLGGQHSLVGQTMQGQGLDQYGLNARNQYGPTADLAKALREA